MRYFDKEHKRYYYYNKETKKTQWVPPMVKKDSRPLPSLPGQETRPKSATLPKRRGQSFSASSTQSVNRESPYSRATDQVATGESPYSSKRGNRPLPSIPQDNGPSQSLPIRSASSKECPPMKQKESPYVRAKGPPPIPEKGEPKPSFPATRPLPQPNQSVRQSPPPEANAHGKSVQRPELTKSQFPASSKANHHEQPKENHHGPPQLPSRHQDHSDMRPAAGRNDVSHIAQKQRSPPPLPEKSTEPEPVPPIPSHTTRSIPPPQPCLLYTSDAADE